MIASILFTGLNTPLQCNITPDDLISQGKTGFKFTANDRWANWGFINERDRLAVSRFLGNGDDHAGFIYTAITFAIISCALTLFAFKNIREMDTDKIQHEPKLPMKKVSRR